MAGVIGSIAIATVRQIKNFGIFFLCGSSWKDCSRIITAYLTIFSFAIVLTLFSMAVMKIINMDYLVDNVEGSIPLYEELTDMGKSTVETVGVRQAKQEAEVEL